MELGENFQAVTPDFEPIFLNLPALPADRLAASGDFGRVLRLVQRRKAPLPELRRLLEETVQSLETMAQEQRLRWLEFLSYIHMLVYHERRGTEQYRLQQTIEASVQADPHRQEIQVMERTIAQEIEARGHRRGQQKGRQEEAIWARRETLLRQLRARFGDVPAATAAAVKGSRDLAQLDTWLDSFAVAKTLDDVGIKVAP